MIGLPFSLSDTQATLIAGAVALALSSVLLWHYLRSKRLLDEMWAVDTYEARELRRMCSGGFRAIVEIQGEITCENPVTAPASTFPCCWCRTIVEREETRVERTRQGVPTRNVWVKAYDRTIFALFKVNDGTGYVLVNPMEANIETEKPYQLVTCEREPWFEGVGWSHTGRYRITETILAPTGYVYVLGQASCAQDGTNPEVMIHRPDEGYINPKHRVFMISRRTEKQIAESHELSLQICFWGSAVGFVFAAYCLLSLLNIAP